MTLSHEFLNRQRQLVSSAGSRCSRGYKEERRTMAKSSISKHIVIALSAITAATALSPAARSQACPTPNWTAGPTVWAAEDSIKVVQGNQPASPYHSGVRRRWRVQPAGLPAAPRATDSVEPGLVLSFGHSGHCRRRGRARDSRFSVADHCWLEHIA